MHVRARAQVVPFALGMFVLVEGLYVQRWLNVFGDGLGLDSIDILEVALEVSQRYGFQLRSDDENNQKIFQNLRSLAAHVAQHRTK